MAFDPSLAYVIGSSAGSAYGQHEANKQNLAIANRQMAFQRSMSNTAHQREVRDLRKAGLNPILSATGGQGATTPQGAQAQMQDALGKGVSSAIEARRLTKEIDAVDSQIALNQSTSQAQRAQAVRDMTSAKQAQTQTRILDAEYPARKAKSGAEKKLYDTVNQGIGNVNTGLDAIGEFIGDKSVPSYDQRWHEPTLQTPNQKWRSK